MSDDVNAETQSEAFARMPECPAVRNWAQAVIQTFLREAIAASQIMNTIRKQ